MISVPAGYYFVGRLREHTSFVCQCTKSNKVMVLSFHHALSKRTISPTRTYRLHDHKKPVDLRSNVALDKRAQASLHAHKVGAKEGALVGK